MCVCVFNYTTFSTKFLNFQEQMKFKMMRVDE
jgi:hypothetical protein